MGFVEEFSEAGVSASAIETSIKCKSFAVGECVFEQGQIDRNIYLPQTGLIKLTYLRAEGSELTKAFIEPGKIFASLISTLTGQPSRFSAICLTPVELEVMPARLFRELGKENPTMLTYSNQMFRNLALRNEEREYDLLCLSAEERYEKFVTKSPEIVRQITQAEIAAFLGITPVALSRIRGRRATRIKERDQIV
jgi:CRP-like cAMP-binding protein